MKKNYAVIDLHLHLDGSLSLESAKELAKLQNIDLPKNDDEIIERLQVSAGCRDLNEYLEKFAFPGTLLQTKEGLSTAVYNLSEELKEQGLLYAEIRFAPQKHMEQGMSQAEVVEAAIGGMKKSDFKAQMILCCMRGNDNHEENLETVRVAGQYIGKGVCAVDLAGAEALFPTENFEDLFILAKELNVPYTIHAGEAVGPSSVYKALEFGAKRIGHGVRSIEDSELMKKLADEKICLEFCPTSNLNTRVYESIEDYPIRAFLDAGVKITINTDNTAVSNTSLKDEYDMIIETFKLNEKEIKQIVNNSIDASFADDETKQWLRHVLDNK